MVVASSEKRMRRSSAPLVGFIICFFGFVGLLFVPLWAPALLRLEHWTADWRTAVLSDRGPAEHERLAVILISDDTLEPYPYLSPIDRGLLANLVRAVDAAGARAVGIDIFFAKETEKSKDEQLLDAFQQAKSKIVIAALDKRGRLKPKQIRFQTEFLSRAARSVGFINLSKDHDGVVRYRPQSHVDPEIPISFSVQLARADNAALIAEPSRISWLLPPRNGERTFFTLPAEALLPGTSAHATSANNGDLRKLKDRIVLIGGDLAYRDRHETPMTGGSVEKMSGVMVHAHLTAQLIDNRRARELKPFDARIIFAALAFVGLLLGWRTQLRGYNVPGIAATAILVGVDILVFWKTRVVLPFTLSVVAWYLGITAGSFLQRIVVGKTPAQ